MIQWSLYIYIYVYDLCDVHMWWYFFMLFMMSNLYAVTDFWWFYVCVMVSWCDKCQYNTKLAMLSAIWLNCCGICVNVIESKCRYKSLTCKYLWKRHRSQTWYTFLSCRTTSWESNKTLRWWMWWWPALVRRPMRAVYSSWFLVAEPKHMLLEWNSSCEWV